MLNGQQAAVLRIEPVVVSTRGPSLLARIVLAGQDRVDHRRRRMPHSRGWVARRAYPSRSTFGVRQPARLATGAVAQRLALGASLFTRSATRSQARKRDGNQSNRTVSGPSIPTCVRRGP